MHNLIKDILTSKVYDVATVTPLDKMQRLSKRLNVNIWLKREDLQPVFSFKLRGAYNAIAQLDVAKRTLGVVTASAGNHAQGVALSGQNLNIPVTIVMPITAPQLKVQACESRGAKVILTGNTFDDACAYANKLCKEQGLSFVHPFDNLNVIAGQGTIGKEIYEQNAHIDAIFIPIGGGGLAAGIATYIKFIAPNCKVIGVEPVDSAAMYESIKKGERVELAQVGGFADGVAVKLVGMTTFELCREHLDEIILVNTDEICAALKDIFDDTRAIAEPAGALAVAGAKKYLKKYPEQNFKNIATILSGANINFDRLRYVAERAEIGEKSEAIFAISIPEEIGSFRRFLDYIGNRSITEFNYRYTNESCATIFVGVHCNDGESEKNIIMHALQGANFKVLDLTDNEIAKSHIRYMIGGKTTQIKHERLLCFKFPERPNALKQFLAAMQSHWNITLFNYRNHGADYGRVLIGMEIVDTELDELNKFISKLGYDCTDETDNPAFTLFL
ncbi:l-threonine dehydratase [Gammaproteobacteria bacterium]|nr:l-threonine dehydratase [Gammaproteobacteria bacterium]